jgi:hypothetical protein
VDTLFELAAFDDYLPLRVFAALIIVFILIRRRFRPPRENLAPLIENTSQRHLSQQAMQEVYTGLHCAAFAVLMLSQLLRLIQSG